ncbi:hypothetical protein CCUS01_03185 [Colletotrichum cuscutae]|uniref:Uncharacterized protein n=1 Tax=Colletotrichum cuscutae TaxID=1209917 RepID=A0AAI9Y9K5_9PEZI|nr:hypothetical protein CCUS01_03185 [Colletotrichum cuscutae]
MAITTSVLLTAASQLASTALLSDFAVRHKPNSDAGLQHLEVKALGLSKVCGTTKAAYRGPAVRTFRRYRDFLRAFIPSANEPSRSRLRNYEGPAAVVDSRVVCVRPVIRNVTFSAVAFDFSNNTRLETYSEFNVLGQFDIQGDYDQLPINRGQNQIDEPKWPFNCVVPAEDIHGYSKGEPLASQIDNFSTCSLGRGENRT